MKKTIKVVVLLVGTVLFSILFWHQKIGFNAAIFTVFVIASLLYFYPESIKSKNAVIIYIGTLLTSIAIFFYSSILSIFVWICSLLLLQTFVHYSEFRTILYGSFSAFLEYITSFALFAENSTKNEKTGRKSKKIFKILRLIIIPFFVFFIFLWIYRAAVPTFDSIVERIFFAIDNWFRNIFKDISFDFIFMLLWGFATMAWYYYKRRNNVLLEEEKKYSDVIKRQKGKELFNISNPRGLKPLLKFENSIAIILVISVNVLLFTVNVIDISTIWFSFKYSLGFDLKQFVHEGTYLLIISILLSMAIMLFFFRLNINFYSKNKFLKNLSYLWIFQNTVLLISVVIRNLHYINHFALAYLRIGLFFFLLMVIVGLITLFIKIKNVKSLFYLLRVNTWALYIAFVIFAMFDWDTIIAKYNLEHYPKAFVEASFMLTLDAKTYPFLDKKRELLNQPDSLNSYKRFDSDYQTEFDNKILEFMEKQKQISWLSSNIADQKAYKYFQERKK